MQIIPSENKKPSKYLNKKTFRFINGKNVKFDSLKEARYFDKLYLLLRAGEISELSLQPKFDLIPTQKWNGKTLRKITYSADFKYKKNGKDYIIDVKPSPSFQTDVYKIKKRLFLMQYGKDFIFEEVYK